MKTLEYLSAVKVELGITSDYALAKALGVSKNSVRNWNAGICGFNENTSRKIAEILNVHPAFVVLDMQREHARDDETRSLWDEIQQGFHAPSRRANPGYRGAPARL